jgi:hypothetical protein
MTCFAAKRRGRVEVPAHPAPRRRPAWKSYDHALYDGSGFGAEETGVYTFGK